MLPPAKMHSCFPHQGNGEKYFGIMCHSIPNTRAEVDVEVGNVRSMPAFMRRKFERLTPNIFLPVYFALVCPSFWYCVQTKPINSSIGIDVIHKMQVSSTGSISGLRRMAYTKRLCLLELFSRRWRRLAGDHFETFKIIIGFVSANPDEFFSFNISRKLCGLSFTLAKP